MDYMFLFLDIRFY